MKPARGRASGHISEPVPGLFRDRSGTVPRPPPYRRRERGGLHCPEVQFTHSANVSASCYPPARREWMQHLTKVLHLPQNLYSTLRKCCACHTTQSLQSLRTAVPMFTSPNPFRDRSETVPGPFHDRLRKRHRDRGGLRNVRKSSAQRQRFCILLSKVLRLPRNLYLTLRKCCACHAIQSLRSLRAAVPMVTSPNPFRDRSETVRGWFWCTDYS